jgi:hypothetical protein
MLRFCSLDMSRCNASALLEGLNELKHFYRSQKKETTFAGSLLLKIRKLVILSQNVVWMFYHPCLLQ